MKVLHISISDAWSGSSIAAFRLHEGMKGIGIKSKMLVLDKTRNDQDICSVNIIERYLISRIGLFYEKMLKKRSKEGMGSFSYSLFGTKLHRHSLVKESDVIYLHWINGGYMSIKSIESILGLNKIVVVVLHDMWFFTGGCHHSYGCEKYKEVCDDCHFFEKEIGFIASVSNCFAKKGEVFSRYENMRIVAPSERFYKMACESKILQNKRVYMISNLINEKKFNARSRTRNNKYVILFGAMGGKSNVYKGWCFFVEALMLLPKDIRDSSVVVLFGYDYKEKDLLDIPLECRSVGVVKDELEMIKIYGQADVFVFPSVYESYGQTVVESMACGTPVVGFDVGVVCQLIKHKYNGYIAKYRDSEDLAIGIEYVLRNDGAIDMVKNSRDIIEECFNANDILRKHMEIINE